MAVGTSATSPRPILVVEDEADIRDMVAEFLCDEGYSVVVASNGLEAFDYLTHTAELPALILLDLMMPVMDGWEFTDRQQRHTTLSDIPVVMISADHQAARGAAELGACGYLTKPIQLDCLLDAIQRCRYPG